MAIVRYFGKFTIFLTYIINLICPEIKRELNFREKLLNRPDIIYRVFKIK